MIDEAANVLQRAEIVMVTVVVPRSRIPDPKFTARLQCQNVSCGPLRDARTLKEQKYNLGHL